FSNPLALSPDELGASALPPASEPAKEASACTLPTTDGSVAPASGTPSASQESPGSSPKACAPSPAEANSPPWAPGVLGGSPSASTANELCEGIRETFTGPAPASGESTADNPFARAPRAADSSDPEFA